MRPESSQKKPPASYPVQQLASVTIVPSYRCRDRIIGGSQLQAMVLVAPKCAARPHGHSTLFVLGEPFPIGVGLGDLGLFLFAGAYLAKYMGLLMSSAAYLTEYLSERRSKRKEGEKPD